MGAPRLRSRWLPLASIPLLAFVRCSFWLTWVSTRPQYPTFASRALRISGSAVQQATPEATWRDEIDTMWTKWTAKHGLQDLSLDLAVDGLLQSLKFAFPYRERFITPYLVPLGQPAGQGASDKDRYITWKTVGVLDAVLKDLRACSSSMPQKNVQMLLVEAAETAVKASETGDWLLSPQNLRNISAFAAYKALVADPSPIEQLMQMVPEDAAVEEEAVAIMREQADVIASNRARYTKDSLQEYDSLFIGHSRFHMERALRLWEDPGITVQRYFPRLCKNTLFNEVYPYHRDDLLENLVDMDESALADLLPTGHFHLIALIGFFPDDARRSFANLRKLLRPGGILVIHPRNPADDLPSSFFAEYGFVEEEDGPQPSPGQHVGPCPWPFRTMKLAT